VFDSGVAARDWESVRESALAIGKIALSRGDVALMLTMSQGLERLGHFAGAAELRLAARRATKGIEPAAWGGEDISNKTLLIDLVEDDPRSLGRVIRHARLIGPAAARAKKVIVRVEARLVPLLRRTFVGVDVYPSDQAEMPETDVYAGFEQLASIFAVDADGLAQSFVPLRADPALTAGFRSRYRGTSLEPLIGLSWGSKSHTKDVPDFRDWVRFIADTPATFVSLQYGKIDAALRRLRSGHSRRIIYDDTVDQLVDMDRFAAQMASLDAVLSISNTGAHLAGALGVPAIFLVDDKFHTAWPVIGDRTPWYPRALVLRPDGREWSAVLDDMRARLEAIAPAADVLLRASR
jgi:hypothetical protein